MYEIRIYDGPNDPEGILIHSPYIDGLKVEGSIDLVVEGVSSFDFTINPNNPAWGNIKNLTTLIKVTNVLLNQVVFDGFVLKPTQTMSSAGAFTTKYTCDSKLSYLNDSHQRWARFQDTTIRELFTYMIEKHNAQVEPHKRFIVGDVTVSNPTDNVYRFIGYENTYDEIQDNLIDRLGGFLRLREETGGTYIDYLAEVGEEKTTPIRLRTNLQDMRREIDPTEIITRIIPLGARLDDEQEDEDEPGSVSTPRVDISSVNDGIDFLDDESLQAEFGIIEGHLILDDVHTPSTLKLRGEQFFASQKAARVSYDVTAVNLYLIDPVYESYSVGNQYPIINPGFNIDEPVQVVGLRLDINTPQRDQLTIGEKYRTLTEYQIEANKKAKRVEDLQSDVSRQSRTIGTLRTELTQVNESVEDVIIRLDDSDLPALEEAIGNLVDAVDNLNESIDDIPVYEPATQTQDGLMSASDKTRLDNIAPATDSQDGLLRAPDQRKLNRIAITQDIDIDQLYADVQMLKNGNGG